jgi:hypothetical protein
MRMPFFSGVSLGTGLLIGAGAVLLAPIVLPVVAGVGKSLLKAGIKGGLIIYEKGKVAIEEAKETIEDLTAEAKAELAGEEEVEAAPIKKKAAMPAVKEGAKA